MGSECNFTKKMMNTDISLGGMNCCHNFVKDKELFDILHDIKMPDTSETRFSVGLL